MAIFIKPKPLHDCLRARIRNHLTSYTSSGSDHDGTASTSIDPSPFSALLTHFLEGEISPPHQSPNPDLETDSPSIPTPSQSTAASLALSSHLRHLLSPHSLLLPEVQSAAQIAAATPQPGSLFRRSVMARLRDRGFNAGICKARWGASHGLTAGSYEYIDVVVPAANDEEEEARFIVDLGFAAEFEVARATEEYAVIASALPEVMVARAEEVREVVIVMAEAVSRLFKGRGMSVPPWRKKRYMMAKWCGFYRRTVNCLPVERGGDRERGVTCRLLGFGYEGGN